MKDHTELSDSQFANQFRDCTFNPHLFSHEAHLRLAYLLIKKHGVEEGANQLCAQIQKFDSTFDDGTKYNKTVTVAAAKAVYHFMQRSQNAGFSALLQEFPKLKVDFMGLIKCHYSFDIFKNEEAKQSFLEPDLLPFT